MTDLKVTKQQFEEKMLAFNKKEYGLHKGGSVWDEVKQDLEQAFFDMDRAGFVLVERKTLEARMKEAENLKADTTQFFANSWNGVYIICKELLEAKE